MGKGVTKPTWLPLYADYAFSKKHASNQHLRSLAAKTKVFKGYANLGLLPVQKVPERPVYSKGNGVLTCLLDTGFLNWHEVGEFGCLVMPSL